MELRQVRFRACGVPADADRADADHVGRVGDRQAAVRPAVAHRAVPVRAHGRLPGHREPSGGADGRVAGRAARPLRPVRRAGAAARGEHTAHGAPTRQARPGTRQEMTGHRSGSLHSTGAGSGKQRAGVTEYPSRNATEVRMAESLASPATAGPFRHVGFFYRTAKEYGTTVAAFLG